MDDEHRQLAAGVDILIFAWVENLLCLKLWHIDVFQRNFTENLHNKINKIELNTIVNQNLGDTYRTVHILVIFTNFYVDNKWKSTET